MKIVVTDMKSIDEALQAVTRIVSSAASMPAVRSRAPVDDDSDESSGSSNANSDRGNQRHFYERILVDTNRNKTQGPLVSNGNGPHGSAQTTQLVADQLANQVADQIVASLVKSGRK